MQFPVLIPLGPWSIHPHTLFESLGYFLAARLFWRLRHLSPDPVPIGNRIWAIAGAAAGGALGSKLLFVLEDPALTLANLANPLYLFGGKTIVGGLLGGLIGVELVKKWIGERQSTGDGFTLPLVLGLAVGRIGCFLTGLADNTHGVATTLPWGIDYGDGVLRHPTQLYEIAFLGLLAVWLLWRQRHPHRSGDLFCGFMIGYMAFRFLVEFVKPYPTPYYGLAATQVASLAGLLYYSRDLPRVLFMKGVVRANG